ncbi:uncharacterized protein LOC131663537 isoform X2 [Phymastichus coffea]|uniref:uncharacterized protein LOC131663537 isoform X2 n=1 Tax=Phymastichus coffea TaxID=108790 RepID=UPI00273A815F|nr:uncharacterized protein LOC131663537 isoform X2 [Phymastichus coffea]
MKVESGGVATSSGATTVLHKIKVKEEAKDCCPTLIQQGSSAPVTVTSSSSPPPRIGAIATITISNCGSELAAVAKHTAGDAFPVDLDLKSRAKAQTCDKIPPREDANGTESRGSSSPSPSSSPSSQYAQPTKSQTARANSSSSARSPESDDQGATLQIHKSESQTSEDVTGAATNDHRLDEPKSETNGTSGARCISAIFTAHSKLRRLLGTLVQFATDISPDTGGSVKALVLNLLSGSLSAEEFHSALQEATNFPLRGFVLPYLKHNLPSLQRDLSTAARTDNQLLRERCSIRRGPAIRKALCQSMDIALSPSQSTTTAASPSGTSVASSAAAAAAAISSSRYSSVLLVHSAPALVGRGSGGRSSACPQPRASWRQLRPADPVAVSPATLPSADYRSRKYARIELSVGAQRLGRRVEEHPRDVELHPGHGGEDEARIGDTAEARMHESGSAGDRSVERHEQPASANPGADERGPVERRERHGGGQRRHVQATLGGDRRANHPSYGRPRGRSEETRRGSRAGGETGRDGRGAASGRCGDGGVARDRALAKSALPRQPAAQPAAAAAYGSAGHPTEFVPAPGRDNCLVGEDCRGDVRRRGCHRYLVEQRRRGQGAPPRQRDRIELLELRPSSLGNLRRLRDRALLRFLLPAPRLGSRRSSRHLPIDVVVHRAAPAGTPRAWRIDDAEPTEDWQCCERLRCH